MCVKLKKKIDVTVNDKIEKRAINKIQINHVVDVLVERANGDVQNILGSWMRENKSTKWSLSLPIVAHIKNRKHHSGTFLIFLLSFCLIYFFILFFFLFFLLIN
jgi:hypothetical protein